MKKKLFIGLACFAVMAAAAIVAISSVNDHTPELSDLLSKNLEALTQNEVGDGGEGEDPQLIKDHFLNCTDGGVEVVVIPKSGSVTIMGVAVTGNKGESVTVVWERWSCQSAPGNDCNSSEAGVKVTT